MDYDFQFEIVLASLDQFVWGAVVTIELAAMAIVLGMAVGVLGAFGKSSGIRPLRWLVGGYVELIRNTPFLVQLYFVYFSLPSLGVKLSANESALLAMVVNLGAYATEIIRAGVEAIPKTQLEAGSALGLSKLEVFRYVILVPALETVYPALTSQFTLTMIATSVVSTISGKELSSVAYLIESQTFKPFEVYIIATAFYIGLVLLFRVTFWALGRLLFTRKRRIQGWFGRARTA